MPATQGLTEHESADLARFLSYKNDHQFMSQEETLQLLPRKAPSRITHSLGPSFTFLHGLESNLEASLQTPQEA